MRRCQVFSITLLSLSLGGADIAFFVMSAFGFAHMTNGAMCAPPRVSPPKLNKVMLGT